MSLSNVSWKLLCSVGVGFGDKNLHDAKEKKRQNGIVHLLAIKYFTWLYLYLNTVLTPDSLLYVMLKFMAQLTISYLEPLRFRRFYCIIDFIKMKFFHHQCTHNNL